MPFAKRIQDFSAAASTRLVVFTTVVKRPRPTFGQRYEAEPRRVGVGNSWLCSNRKPGGSSRGCRAIPRGGQLVRSSALRRAVRQRMRHGVHVREGRLGHPGPKPPALCVMLFIGCQSSQPTRNKKQGSRGGEWSRGAG